MSKETRQPFTSTGEYHTRRGFRFSGRSYAPNVDFPWRQLCISPRKLRQLYEGRFIEPGLASSEEVPTTLEVLESLVTEKVTTEETKDKGEEQSKADPGETEEGGEEQEEPKKKKGPQKFVFNPKHHQVRSAGSGGWKVTTNSGKFRLSITRKEAQRLKKVRKKTEVSPEEIVE